MCELYKLFLQLYNSCIETKTNLCITPLYKAIKFFITVGSWQAPGYLTGAFLLKNDPVEKE